VIATPAPGAAIQFGPLAVILNHNFRETPHRWHVTAIIRSAADSAW
jgi:hypothetical protein